MLTGYLPVGSPAGSNEFHHITSHDLTLGVRWMFGVPQPAEPLYPLVRKG